MRVSDGSPAQAEAYVSISHWRDKGNQFRLRGPLSYKPPPPEGKMLVTPNSASGTIFEFRGQVETPLSLRAVPT